MLFLTEPFVISVFCAAFARTLHSHITMINILTHGQMRTQNRHLATGACRRDGEEEAAGVARAVTQVAHLHLALSLTHHALGRLSL